MLRFTILKNLSFSVAANAPFALPGADCQLRLFFPENWTLSPLAFLER